MLQTIVLICAAALDPSACSEANALDVMRLPPARAALCGGMTGEAALARVALRPEPGKTYAKFVCRRQASPAR